MVISLTGKDPVRLSVDALVVATAEREGGPQLVGADWLPAALRTALTSDARALGITGATGEVRRVPATGLGARVLVLTGVGATEPDAEALRRAAGAATRELAGIGSVALALPAGDVAQVAAVAEGALLGAYTFARYRRATGDASASTPVAEVQVVTHLAKDKAALAAHGAPARTRPRRGGRRCRARDPRPGEHPSERPLPGRSG